MPYRISRRHVVAGLAALRFCGLQPARAASPEETARPLADRLAAYADRLSYGDLDAATIERVKSHVIDTLGCGIAAFDEKPVRICRDIALAHGGDTSSVIGTDRRTMPDLATFANGAAFRYYDLNDVYVGHFTGHPSDHIAACLAVAEAERATASELITAIVLAYEINCRLADVVDIGNWDTPVLSLPAVALSAGKLMKLPPDRLLQAVNLAINDHIPMGQTRTQSNSDWKGLADAEAGRNAVFAAMLARDGLTGPEPIFEGRKGFFALVSKPAEVDVGAFGRRDVSFRIHQCGMKPYQAVIYAQTAIVASVAIAKEAGDLDRIAAIEIATTRRGYEQTGRDPEKWTPATRDTADHSLPYITARAMFDGEINNDSYEPGKFRDPRILSFMRKITVSEDQALTARTGPSTVPTRITAILADGRRIVSEVDDVPGFVGRPMNRADIERKFRSNVGKRWPAERTDAVLQALWALEETKDLSLLLGMLSMQTKR
ncbi:MAG TPA: MmgE/PrpD family protein [Pseudolabrys sp.]|nr:MmgE/PrpD family protein [Pseudolabrys sp.]